MEYILWRYRNLSTIVHTTWRRPKHGGDRMLAGIFLIFQNFDFLHVLNANLFFLRHLTDAIFTFVTIF